MPLGPPVLWLYLGFSCSLHTYSGNQCPVKECSHPVDKDTVCSHFLNVHTTLNISIKMCMDALVSCSSEIFDYGKALIQAFS